MSDERFTSVDRLLGAALERAPHERAAFLREACPDDEALRRNVESLLAHHSGAAGFLSTPAFADGVPGTGASFVGRQLGPYTIQAPLGAGGMGEVYRARDSKLGRDVAIKILPRLFTTDPERRARFDREARLLASLNHPHIGAIYGVEDIDGTPALILELVEGDTLAERMAGGTEGPPLRSSSAGTDAERRGRPSGRPMPLDEALHIARQIADALEAAHEKGIIHRDLKPANIKITTDGVVKVLDFGLARAVGPPAFDSAQAREGGPHVADLTQSPTVMNVGTRDGVILGTAAYMSPEQARGKPVDKRTDIWAFGCVLYEMLTGRAPFAGETLSDMLAAILEREPNWEALPPATSDKVRSMLRRCLQKDPHRRLRDIGDARLDIDDAIAAPAPVGVGATPVRNTGERLLWVAALITVAVGAAGIARYAGGRQTQLNEVRFELNVPPTTDPTSFAISPDGTTLVFVATSEGKSRLWLRSLASVSARPLAGTENAKFPFWSPDGRSVGFSANAQLRRVDLDSGSVRVLVSDGALGGTWNQDGTILFDRGPGGALFRVSADGGERTAVTQVSQEVTDPWFPQFLPNQRHFLFYATGTVPGIYIGQLGASGTRRLFDAEAVAYASTGHLLFVRQGTLFAQAFDPVRLELAGSPMAVAEQMVVGPGPGVAALSASAAGPIVYRTGDSGTQSHFVWFDRSGKALETVAGSDIGGGYNSSLSPDGSRLAMSRRGGTSDIWLLDLNRGVPSRFTFDPQDDLMPVWSPDGKRIAFSSNRKRAADSWSHAVYVKPVTGIGTDDLLVGTDQSNPSDWSHDGRFILLVRQRGGQDIWALPLGGDRKAFPVVETPFNETNGQFSPDGRWIAYQSNESGRVEIFLQPFPGPGHKALVSSNGGVQVRWRHDGKELFYLAPDNRLMAVRIQLDATAESVDVDTPMSLFAPHLSGTPQNYMGRHYMVSRDGQRFLMDTLKEVTLPITVSLNWKPKP